MTRIFLAILLVVGATAPSIAGPVAATAFSSFQFYVTATSGSQQAIDNLKLTLDLTSFADVDNSDGTQPGGGSEAVAFMGITGDSHGLADTSGLFNLGQKFDGYVSATAESATADGVVTTAEASIILPITIEADPSLGEVVIELHYIADDTAAFMGGSVVSISGAGTSGGEAFSGTAATSTELGADADFDPFYFVLANTEASLDGDEKSLTRYTSQFAVVDSSTFHITATAKATTTATAVPEPSSFLLLGMLGLIGAWRQRYSKSKAS